MRKMKNSIIKLTALFSITVMVLNSCGPNQNPPLVYFPDMYFPVAYDPLMKAEDAYSKHENEIPAFVRNDGATGLGPIDGTVSRNKDGVIEDSNDKALTPDQYNGGYDIAKTITNSPLDPKNFAKDIERGKGLYEKTCSACHGVGGNGQGPIVTSGAYSGVPAYADRDITVASVHYVMMNGRNAMGSYAGMLNAGDRWRVAMYVMNAFKKNAAAPANAAVATTATETPAVK
ncbi:c-type cytochrome [Frigoriflavimonas asaccharolytica]|nr:cytochrome c [Frigoriflavimonas asaccharolytica]